MQLLPAGKFKAVDGRPHDTPDGYWHLDASSAAALIAATKSTFPKVLIDYEHQTLRTEENGQKAIASGWLTSNTDIEWREGQGLYIKPDWTAPAKQHIDAKEYAFLSAVFPYDKKTGTPLLLRMAALTNDPGLVGLESVAALAADIDIRISKPGASINLYGTTEEAFMNEALKKLLERLGIVVDGELTDELATAATAALTALQDKANKTDGLTTELATLKANLSTGIDLSKYVPIDTYNGVVGELAVLKAGSDQTSIESAIKEAREAGKVVESELDYLKSFGEQQGVAALSAMLDKRAPIAALTAKQTGQTTVNDGKDKHDKGLTESDLAVLKATGLDKAEYLKAKETI
ncbi:phage protease [Vibrio nomapromontoriensis]|uniref:phage protease n=1 Tax=Vibrio nomapromontoriensis TaxID=2910246 RepID=UPI003D11D9DC